MNYTQNEILKDIKQVALYIKDHFDANHYLNEILKKYIDNEPLNSILNENLTFNQSLYYDYNMIYHTNDDFDHPFFMYHAFPMSMDFQGVSAFYNTTVENNKVDFCLDKTGFDILRDFNIGSFYRQKMLFTELSLVLKIPKNKTDLHSFLQPNAADFRRIFQKNDNPENYTEVEVLFYRFQKQDKENKEIFIIPTLTYRMKFSGNNLRKFDMMKCRISGIHLDNKYRKSYFDSIQYKNAQEEIDRILINEAKKIV